jgi:hypothetical protein
MARRAIHSAKPVIAPRAVQKPQKPQKPQGEPVSAVPMGRPSREFRDRVVEHIKRYVRSTSELEDLAVIMNRDVGLLYRWLGEDVPGFVLPPDAAVDEPAAGGRAFGIEALEARLLERQGVVLLEMLRDQSQQMTIHDLQVILTSHLGRYLAGMRLDHLFYPTVTKSPPGRLGLQRSAQAIDEAVVAYLHAHPGWVLASKVRVELNLTYSRLTSALRRLRGSLKQRGRRAAAELALIKRQD